MCSNIIQNKQKKKAAEALATETKTQGPLCYAVLRTEDKPEIPLCLLVPSVLANIM